VKVAIHVHEAHHVAQRDVLFCPLEDHLQGFDVLGGAALCGKPGAVWLQHQPHFHTGHDVLKRHGVDDDALARNDFYHVLQGQARNGVVHRGAPESKLFADLRLVDIRSRPVIQGDDAELQALVGNLGQ